MPEPQEEEKLKDEEKNSKILSFFSTAVKETKKEKIKPLTKIVIRRLPPRLTKEALLAEISLPPHDFFYFVRGDLSLGQHSFSRAYVNFVNPDDIFAFKEKYDDHPMQDEQGREFYAVVEWAPVQRVPKKCAQKKAPKSGPLETDPKYIEFLEKLEKEKNSAGNTSEYFMETENISTKETKITTTPLLEFLKVKKQQKLDLRNENRLRKREAEKDRRRKEDEMRKSDKIRKAKEREKQILKADEKLDSVSIGNPEKRDKEKDLKVKKTGKDDIKAVTKDKKADVATARPEKGEMLEVKTSRHDEKVDRRDRNPRIEVSQKPRENSDSPIIKNKKYVTEERKGLRTAPAARKSTASNKPISPRIDDSKNDLAKAAESGEQDKSQEEIKRDSVRTTETKSKFRYSEQRNQRNQKIVKKTLSEDVKTDTLEMKEERTDCGDAVESPEGRIRRQSTQETSDGSVEGEDLRSSGGERQRSGRKDPRTERRIRNKDRPSIEIYRPGMGKFSKQRLEQKKEDGEPEFRKEEINDSEEKKKDAQVIKVTRTKDDDIKPFKGRRKLEESQLKKEKSSDGPISIDSNFVSRNDDGGDEEKISSNNVKEVDQVTAEIKENEPGVSIRKEEKELEGSVCGETDQQEPQIESPEGIEKDGGNVAVEAVTDVGEVETSSGPDGPKEEIEN